MFCLHDCPLLICWFFFTLVIIILFCLLGFLTFVSGAIAIEFFCMVLVWWILTGFVYWGLLIEVAMLLVFALLSEVLRLVNRNEL